MQNVHYERIGNICAKDVRCLVLKASSLWRISAGISELDGGCDHSGLEAEALVFSISEDYRAGFELFFHLFPDLGEPGVEVGDGVDGCAGEREADGFGFQ